MARIAPFESFATIHYKDALQASNMLWFDVYGLSRFILRHLPSTKRFSVIVVDVFSPHRSVRLGIRTNRLRYNSIIPSL